MKVVTITFSHNSGRQTVTFCPGTWSKVSVSKYYPVSSFIFHCQMSFKVKLPKYLFSKTLKFHLVGMKF